MKSTDFLALKRRQQHVMVLAMVVRNSLEEFHAANLSDAQMKEMNQVVRYALDRAVELVENRGDAEGRTAFNHLVGMIPDYWEIPGRDSDPNSVASSS